LALNYLRAGGQSTVMNCGYGHEASVREVIASVERVTGRPLPPKESPRRAGDRPGSSPLLERSSKCWAGRPQHCDLDETVRTALAWEKKLNSSG
jgi:UDP-glucose 4-epimerase